jgi:hypothetical protein
VLYIIETIGRQLWLNVVFIGGKSYGTQEQCFHEWFELTENIRKNKFVSRFVNMIQQDLIFN